MNHILDFSNYFTDCGARAAFSLKKFPCIDQDNRKTLVSLFDLDTKQIVIPKQSHSNNVVICSKPGAINNTDGIITGDKNLVLTIQVADCIPIFLVDPVSNNFGMIHAGWRGIVNGIVSIGIHKLVQLDAKPKNIEVILGPSIRQCCFEVGPEVSKKFDSSYIKETKDHRKLIDLQCAVTQEMIVMGIRRNKIIDANECTFCNNEKYYSYRRGDKSPKRMIAMLGWQ